MTAAWPMPDISVHLEEHIATVTLDRPPVNAITRGTMAELRDAFVALSAERNVRVAILTATRPSETTGGRWLELDMRAALWTIPAERMKAGREHRVTLSREALAILRDLAQLR